MPQTVGAVWPQGDSESGAAPVPAHIAHTRLARREPKTVESGAVPVEAPDPLWFHSEVERWRDTVYRVAFNYLGSAADADDVCQDVFIALFRSGKEFTDDEHVKAWLIRVTCNRCKNMLRVPWRQTRSIDDYAETLSDERVAHDETENLREIFSAVMALPTKQRMSIYLCAYEGYSTEDAAQLLGASAAEVRTWISRGRKRLGKALGREG